MPFGKKTPLAGLMGAAVGTGVSAGDDVENLNGVA